MEEISAERQMAKIGDFQRGFKAIHLINIGAKLGVFQALNEAKEGIRVSELASKLGLYEPYLKIWCQTAYCFEILDCDKEGRFKFQPFMDEVLGNASSAGNHLSGINLVVNVTGERLKDSADYYHTGRIMESYTPERSEMVAEATRMLHRVIISGPLPMLSEDDPIRQMLDQGIRFLDVGCGRGDFIIELAQSFGNSRFTGIDPVPHGIEGGKRIISQLGLEERVSLEHSGGEELPYNDEFDIVGMVLVFHEILPDVRVRVVAEAYQALRKDGKLWMIDFSYPVGLEDFRNTLYGPGVIDQFDETCLGVVHLNAHQQNGMLSDAGFTDIQRTSLRGIDTITATK
ncbi:MAG: class I SAM-dependent methyltransferase [Dehalococcoidia bacterium]